MFRVTLIALFLSISLPTTAFADLYLDSRTPINLLLSYPYKSGTERVKRSTLLDTVTRALAEKTGLRPYLVESDLSSKCRASILCVVQQVDRKAQRELFLFVVIVPGEGGDQFVGYLVETKEVIQHLAVRRSTQELVDYELNLIIETGKELHLGQKFNALLKNEDEAKIAVDSFLEDYLRIHLEPKKEWKPFGSVTVEGNVGDGLEVDGDFIGRFQSPVELVHNLRSGTHSLVVSRPGYLAQKVEVKVQPSSERSVTTHLIEAPIEGVTSRDVTLYGGIGLMVAGAAVTVAGIVHRSNTDENSGAVGVEGPLFYGTGYSAEERTNSGVLLLPLGYSLFGGGAALVTGGLSSSEREVPWWSWILGTAIATSAYGVSAAVN